MLLELAVRNLALAESLKIEFSKGLNILTGETGAGKSIIVGALGLLLGSKATADMVRNGSESALVEGTFDPSGIPGIGTYLESMGIPLTTDEPDITISREIARSGKTRCRVNGRTVSISQLKEIGEYLIDICGQHENQSLFSQSKQLGLLDRLGGTELLNLRQEIVITYRHLREAIQEREQLIEKSRELARTADLLTHQVTEIREASLDKIDEAALKQERLVLANSDKLITESTRVYSELYESMGVSPSIIDSLGKLSQSLENLARLDTSLSTANEQLVTAWDTLRDVARSLRQYKETLDYDPERLQKIEETLDAVSKLKRKYGDTIEEILNYASQAEAELERFTNSEERLISLDKDIKVYTARYVELAITVSELRRKTADRLSRLMDHELKDLNMPDARFMVSFTKDPSVDGIVIGNEKLAYGPTGIDKVEFQLSPNPGEDMKPITRIASGGELSRVMLAIKSVLGSFDDIPTMVFDEIDAGIGGLTATAVANKLATIGYSRQVICVTHLSQIACVGNAHLRIHKEVHEGRTRTEVTLLSHDDRVLEIVRMLGSEATDSTTRLVEEMLEKTRPVRTA